MDELLRQRLWLNVSGDFEAYLRVREAIEGSDTVHNPALDPKWCPLDDQNALWLHLIDKQGKTVSLVGGKQLPDGESLEDLLRSRRLWFQRGPRPATERDDFEYLSTSAGAAVGRGTLTGGLWVREDFRKARTPDGFTPISKLLTILIRAVIIDRFESDYHVGMWTPTLQSRNYGRDFYMYDTIGPCVRGTLLPSYGPVELWMGQAPLAETIRMFGDELSRKPVPAFRRVASM